MHNRKRLTQEQFVSKLKEKNPDITVLGEYVNINTKVRVKCNKCGHEWDVLPCSLLYVGTGCPQCHFKVMHDNFKANHSIDREAFVRKINDKFPNLELISEYKSLSEDVTLRCKDCGYVFTKLARLVLSSKGCKRCVRQEGLRNRSKICKEMFIERMKKVNPNITVLGEYERSSKPLLVRCNVCGHEWYSDPNNLLRGRGCMQCYKASAKGRKLKKSKKWANKLEENFKKKLVDKGVGVTLISEYKGFDKNVTVRCNDCGAEYITKPMNLVHNGGKCPLCKNKRQGPRAKVTIMKDFARVAEDCLSGKTCGVFVCRDGSKFLSIDMRRFESQNYPYRINSNVYDKNGCLCNPLCRTRLDIVGFKDLGNGYKPISGTKDELFDSAFVIEKAFELA